ncbi:S-4TM family putative pore-forming effector [Mycolicibacterium mucogenicum]|jgi:hypothetical protein|uniref:Uncharacterized protein n=1 Tax=Mycolicibacterium mucogenicum DSM 44124 TaxID=1226753 RepID=A0A8E4RCR2_MYCMU|nr:hypothetical protein C1S78_014565 [Mycolicibacterium mucogenicum DSM 44124]
MTLTTPSIFEAKNTRDARRHVAAQARTYCDAKRVLSWRVAAVFLLALAWAVCAVKSPSVRSVVGGVGAVAVLLLSFAAGNLEKVWRYRAAAIQEEFDTDVFRCFGTAFRPTVQTRMTLTTPRIATGGTATATGTTLREGHIGPTADAKFAAEAPHLRRRRSDQADHRGIRRVHQHSSLLRNGHCQPSPRQARFATSIAGGKAAENAIGHAYIEMYNSPH